MQIVELAGYKPTPAEELPDEESVRSPATREQLHRIGELISALAECEAETDWKARAQQLAGAPASMLTSATARVLIEQLEDELNKLASVA